MILDDILRILRERVAIKFVPKGSIICDIGCNNEALFLKRASPIIKYGFGFDKEVMPCRNSKVELRKADLEGAELNIGDNSVDVVTMLAVVEHLDDKDNVLREIFRILKKDGVLVLTTPSPRAKLILEFLAFKMGLINRKEIKDHKNYLSSAELLGLLANAGFQPQNIKIKLFELGLNILAIATK